MTDEKRKEVLDFLLKGKSIGDIIEKNIPQYLYKYRSGSAWDMDALENDSIWMACATKMDDPLDSKILLSEKSKAQIRYVINNVDKFRSEKYRIHLEEDSIQRECYLCSLSEEKNSQDMWSRYADNERGFCIEYDARKLVKKVKFPILPVYYDKKIEWECEDLSKLDKKSLIVCNFLIKDKLGKQGEDWYSQREWRIISFKNNMELENDAQDGKCIQVIKPTRIILGKNIIDKNKKRIIHWQEKKENQHIMIVQRV